MDSHTNSYYSPPPPPDNYTYYSPPPPSPSPPPPSPPPCVCPPVPPPCHWPPGPAPQPPPSPSPPPQPPPPPPGSPTTIYIAVFVSLGGAFFLAFLAVGLLCLAKRRKRAAVMIPAEVAEVCAEEHQRIQETITTGPCGEQTVTITVDDDKQIHEIAEVGVIEAAGAHGRHHLKNG